MALEDNQAFQNRAIVAAGNNSPSGELSEVKRSLKDNLIKSAEAFAAGKTLGMSEEETWQ